MPVWLCMFVYHHIRKKKQSCRPFNHICTHTTKFEANKLKKKSKNIGHEMCIGKSICIPAIMTHDAAKYIKIRKTVCVYLVCFLYALCIFNLPTSEKKKHKQINHTHARHITAHPCVVDELFCSYLQYTEPQTKPYDTIG